MKKIESFWTKKRDRQLLRLQAEFSASQIGERLGATRNAVIGRLHRLHKTRFPYRDRRREARRAADEAKIEAENLAVEWMVKKLSDGMDRRLAVIGARTRGATYWAIAKQSVVKWQQAA